jgi:hypothetical protein
MTGLTAFFPLAFNNTNVTAYREQPLLGIFQQNAAALKAELNNPNYTQIGKNIDVLRAAFSASKAAGKPWQIWAGTTSTSSMGTHSPSQRL